MYRRGVADRQRVSQKDGARTINFTGGRNFTADFLVDSISFAHAKAVSDSCYGMCASRRMGGRKEGGGTEGGERERERERE